jgi:hypothetical protein
MVQFLGVRSFFVQEQCWRPGYWPWRANSLLVSTCPPEIRPPFDFTQLVTLLWAKFCFGLQVKLRPHWIVQFAHINLLGEHTTVLQPDGSLSTSFTKMDVL